MSNASYTFAGLCLLAAMSAQAAGAELVLRIEAGAAMTSQFAVKRADGKTDLVLVLEGAGRLSMGSSVLRFHIGCAITDVLEGQRVLEGAGQCTLTATDGGLATVQFQTVPGAGDIGHLVFSGGTQGFAGVAARIPVTVSVNPFKIAGKKVFFIENNF